jgi:hypothetical protein
VGGVGRWADRAHEITSTRVQWEGVTDFERGVCRWQGGFEQCCKIGAGRVESREKGKLGLMEFRIACHCDGRNCQDQKYRFQAIVNDRLACIEAKQRCSNKSVA